MKPGKTGVARIIDATQYSMKGLRAAWRFEAAFRQEVLLLLVLLPVLVIAELELSERLLLLMSLLGLLITELLNSAIEAVVDRIGPDFHELSGRAKDIASAAVFIAISQFIVVWVAVLWPL
ncbi:MULTISPECIES: diacylglycerol kinase [Idiomarina]|uniref:diacylglycerol kinase n=1 Tax=Idiomarina TaxID=135575 RepID=UPI00129B9DED|nr:MULTISPECIES: diacylglycerol kinase [Idiomarina]MRJ41250.1 diacylglycerol kinase [Idiomarina sp. FeN1]NCU56415.1 diacylglycerol kinase [Idiomarina sp. FenA--70]NCU59434.1 diacylglycerol kinase [Idiomarina sp. FenBw--71]UUN12607.1 diacylglycerol kinase [Idiomarina loihiensis]